MYRLNSRTLKLYCKYFCNVPVVIAGTCPHICSLIPRCAIRPFSLLPSNIKHFYSGKSSCLRRFQNQLRIFLDGRISGSVWYPHAELAPSRMLPVVQLLPTIATNSTYSGVEVRQLFCYISVQMKSYPTNVTITNPSIRVYECSN